jgi:hypothetical protein
VKIPLPSPSPSCPLNHAQPSPAVPFSPQQSPIVPNSPQQSPTVPNSLQQSPFVHYRPQSVPYSPHPSPTVSNLSQSSFSFFKQNLTFLIYRKTPYLVPRINHGNKYFSKLFNRGLKCINKVFLKSFWFQKFTFKTRINGQENFFFDFFTIFFTCFCTGTKYENRSKSIIFT